MEVRNNNKIDLCFTFDNYQLRKELARPYGILFVNNKLFLNFLSNKFNSRIITIGDYVTNFLESNRIFPFLEIVDGKTKRSVSLLLSRKMKEYKAINEQGRIRFSVIDIIKTVFRLNDSSRILIDGEEDLLVMPVVLYSADGDLIIYGQPNAGAVMIINNDLIRWRVKNILQKAKIINC
ncbi:MAG: DUF359 domain-containing protein [Sulfolobaceae archaeon]